MTTFQPGRSKPTFEHLRDSLYQSLLEKVLLDEQNTNKRFFSSDTGKTVLRDYDLKRLFDWVREAASGRSISLNRDEFAHRVKQRELQTFLAILIYSNCTIGTLSSFVNSLIVPEQWPLYGETGKQLGALPVSRQDALDILGDRVAADNFWKNQDEFCAVIIKEDEEVVCDSHRRLPYLKEELLGVGSFGTVAKVDIAPSHFLTSKGHSNPNVYTVARKDYILTEDSTHERERDFLRELLRNPKKHENILQNLGSLQMESTYSLFMELADCDLWDYMTVHHPKTPAVFSEKATILHCAVELAEAVAYLHDDIRTDNFEKLSCFHMDLKPRNILVVTEKAKTGEFVQRWKLSDFNMSKARVKHKSDHVHPLQRSRTFADNIYDLNKLFQKRRPTVNDPSITDATANPRGDGTYLAPEACMGGGKVQAESDTWSLGCVLCVVFSYLDSGARGVFDFRDLRSIMPKDQFFTISGSKARLSLSVHKWLKELRARAHRRSKEEGPIVREFLTFLHRSVLVVDPGLRKKTKARDIAKELGKTYRSYYELAGRYPALDNSLGPRAPIRAEERTKKKGFFSFSSSGHRKSSPPPQPTIASVNSWRLDLLDSLKVSACEFGPNGDILVYLSNSTLTAVSLRNVLDTNDIEDLIEFGSDTLEGLTWNTVAVSKQYIIATTNQQLFDCHIFYISDSSSHTSKLEKKDRILLKLPPIWKMALSPDGKYCAFVLRNYDSENAPGQIYILPLDLLLGGGSNRSEILSSRDSIETSTSISSASTSFLWRGGHSIVALPDAAEDVCDFQFSEQNVLYAVSQPEQSASRTEHKVTVLAWSISDTVRQALSPIHIIHDGSHDISEGLFTSFAFHRQEQACTVLSQERELIFLSFETREQAQSRVSYRLLKILMSENDDRVICFGTKVANDELWLLTTPRLRRGRSVKIQEIEKLRGMTRWGKFSASLFRADAQSDVYVLVASMDGRIHQVKIS